jgi:peptide/nickel transport system substrate-binding protein
VRKPLLVALSFLLTVALCACSKGGTGNAGPNDELRISLSINPIQLNGVLAQNAMETFVEGLIDSVLVTLDSHHNEVPDLATVVPTLANGGISKDGLTITYHLRHGVTWHDGAPFTSRDVKFTWQAIMNPANNVVTRRGYDQVASIDTPNDFTVVMHMKRVYAPAIDTIFGESDLPLRILPAHLLAKYPNLNQVPYNAAPVGTGPFKFARWLRGDRIVLTANPTYFRGAPKLKQLTLFISSNDETTRAQLLSHEVDLALQMSGAAYRSLANEPNVVRQLGVAPVYSAILFNTLRPPLDDVRVRRALVLGMDRARITQNVTFGIGRVAVADLGPFYWAFDSSLQPVPYDTNQAKALLDAAGWHSGPDGIRVKNGERLSLQLIFGRGNETARSIAAQVQQMYKAIGVDIALKNYDFALMYAAAENGGIVEGGKFDLTLYSWVSGADPDNSSQWTCAAIPPAGNNITHYCSPEMDSAQRLALSTFDRNVRKKAYARIESLLLRDAPGAFLYYRSLSYAHIPQLLNFEPNGISEGWNAQEWSR